MGCRLWGRTESDTTEATQQQQQHAELYFPNLEFNPAFPSFSCWGLSFTNQIYSYKILIWKESV